MRTATPARSALPAAALAAAALAAGSAGAAGLPTLFTGSGPTSFAVRPVTIIYTGDGTGILGRFPTGHRGGSLHWTRWNASGAAGTGTVWLNDCKPSCATGSYASHGVTVTASQAKGGRFGRLTLRYRAGGRAVTDTRVLERIASSYQWGIAP